MKKWLGLAAVLVVIAVLALLAVSMGRGLLAFLNGADSGGEADPMFAEPAERLTRPPELAGEAAPGAEPTPEDPSSEWVYEETSPVDLTAEELGRLEGSPET